MYFFKAFFESIPDFRKVMLLLFLLKKADKLLHECCFQKMKLNVFIKS